MTTPATSLEQASLFQGLVSVATASIRQPGTHSGIIPSNPSEIDAFRGALHASLHDLSQRLALFDVQLRKSRNKALIINCLPEEILALIFLFGLEVLAIENRRDHRHVLRQVCCHWRAVLHSSPVLWASISAYDGITSALEALERSKQSKLQISSVPSDLCAPGDSLRRSPILIDLLMDTILPHLHRWQAVYLDISRCLGYVRKLGGLSPSLEVLDLKGNIKEQDILNLSLDRSPRLRTLKLSNVRLHFDLAVLQNLDHLTLHFTHKTSVPIFQILDVCVNLKLVDLAFVECPIAPIDEASVELPALEVIVLKKISPRLLVQILSRYSLRNSRYSSFDCSNCSNSEVFGAPNGPSIQDLLITQFVSKEVYQSPWRYILSVVGNRTGLDLGYRVGTEDRSFNLQFSHRNCWVGLEGLLQMLVSAGPRVPAYVGAGLPVHLQISKIHRLLPPTIVAPLNRLFVDQLEIDDVSPDVITQIVGLLTSPSFGDPPEGWWLPWLRSLVLDACTLNSDALLSMIKVRYAAFNQAYYGLPLPLGQFHPRLFQSFVIKTFRVPRTHSQRLRDAIGDQSCLLHSEPEAESEDENDENSDSGTDESDDD